jgi:hypothetical protein
MSNQTYRDGGALTCSKCGASCLAHYEARLPGEQFKRNDLCHECAQCAENDGFTLTEIYDALQAGTDREDELEMEMCCNNCGNPASFTDHDAFNTEPHGETHHDEWQACVHCGAKSEIGSPDAVYHRPAIRAAEAR